MIYPLLSICFNKRWILEHRPALTSDQQLSYVTNPMQNLRGFETFLTNRPGADLVPLFDKSRTLFLSLTR